MSAKASQNHQPHDWLVDRLFKVQIKENIKLRVTGICAMTGEFPAQRASNAENVFIWWRNHGNKSFASSSSSATTAWPLAFPKYIVFSDLRPVIMETLAGRRKSRKDLSTTFNILWPGHPINCLRQGNEKSLRRK